MENELGAGRPSGASIDVAPRVVTLRARISYWFRTRLRRIARFIEAVPKAFQKIRIKRPGTAFVQTPSTSSARASFEGPPFDMAQITIAYERDDYVRQAVDKYTELCAKEGWNFVGPSEEAVSYIKNRFDWMEIFSGRTTDELLNQINYDIIKYGNAFLAKARMPRRGSLPFRAVPVGRKPAVAYYEPLNPTTIRVARNINGDVIAYQQDVGTGTPITFAPDDIIHFAWKRESGNFFGVPWIWPAIEDVKLLRVLESNMETLIRKYVFPILHAKIGMPTPGYEAEDADIEKAKEDFAAMPPEGIWVTPERYQLNRIGMDNSSLDIKPYLEYMEKRVFTGLGVSETTMGRGGTANRSTASQQTKEMHDRAKAVQRVTEHGFKLHIINELLMEGGFDPVSERDEDLVLLRYNEIDLDSLFKRENAAIYKFEHNVQGLAETREELGKDPNVDLSDFHLYLIEIPRAQAKIDPQQGLDDTDNRQRPANQYGKKPSSAGDKANESAWNAIDDQIRQVESIWAGLADQVEAEARKPLPYPRSVSRVLARRVDAAAYSARYALRKQIGAAIIAGASAASRQLGRSISGRVDVGAAAARIEPLLEAHLTRLSRDLTRRLDQALQENTSPARLRHVVEATTYRLRFIARENLGRAYHYGFAQEAVIRGLTEATVVHSDGACATCRAIESVDLTRVDMLERLPPFHPGDCRCSLLLQPVVLTRHEKEEVSA